MRRNRLVLERIFIGRWWFKQEGFLQHRFTIQFVSVCFFYDSISFRSILAEAPRKPNIHSFVLVLVLFSFFFHSRVYVYIQIIESSTLRRQKKKTHTQQGRRKKAQQERRKCDAHSMDFSLWFSAESCFATWNQSTHTPASSVQRERSTVRIVLCFSSFAHT